MTTGNLAGAAELSQDQQELVNLLLGEEGIEVEPPRTIVPRQGDPGTAPLSFAQQRLWFLDRLDPGSPAYNMFGAYEVRGPLDAGVLRASLNEVVRRHESLRTTFVERHGEPVQVIAPAAVPELAVIDLGRIRGAAPARRVAELLGEEARRPFDLARGPLLRATLLRLGAERWTLAVAMHHIVSDGWSVRVFVREASTLYEALSAGRPSPLAALPIQYADFACWQRQRFAGELLDRELAWWKAELGDGFPALKLPTDRPRAAQRTARGGSFSFALPEPLAGELEALTERRGATLFMTLLAAFEALLYRYSSQERFAVGTPIANRHRAETEDLIGFFVNTLVLGAELGPETSFAELLGRVREVALAAYDHQELPFERLVEELAPQRDRSRTPLFQVMFAMHDVPSAPFELSGLEWSPLNVASAAAKFDLSLSLTEAEGGIAGLLEYDRSLFDAATVRRMSRHFEDLLAAAVKAPAAALASLSYLSRTERHHLLREGNDHPTDASPEVSIPELFEARARRTPEAVAAAWNGGGPAVRISYRELGERAGKLARRLGRRGSGVEDVVGICLGRGPDWAVAVLGVLEAGAAYLPLDPAHPRERLAFMARDAAVRAVVTRGAAAEALDGVGVERLPVEQPEDDPGGARPPALSPAHLAYVVYTSGSTGRPKGVPVTHRNLAALLLWSREYFGFGEHTRVLQTLSPAFDFGSMELLSTLLFGGTLVFPEPGEWADPAAYAGAAREHGINTIHATPSFFREVVAAGQRFDELETLHLGGEALNRETVDRLFAALGDHCTIYNGYGPTEATINCAIFTVGRRARRRDARRARTPIGRPSAGNRAYVLDRRGRCLPAGLTGELHVGGGGVARGYLRRPRRTAEKFVPDSLTGTACSRLYRTGDLTRLLPDGTLEFLGRVDHQVKIRGFRIELGEVEAVLAELDGVRDAVVLAHGAASGEERLVAYLAASASTASELRALLRAKLPEYMVPAAFVFLGELPKSPNGKVDRAALPEPGRGRDSASETAVAPRTPMEELLAGIWAQVLGHGDSGQGPIGVFDSFFELGGHSLLATRVISRIREVLEVELPLHRVFETPTVADLAAAVAELRQQGSAPPVSPIVPVARDGELPLSYPQERLWFLDQLEGPSPLYNVPIALELRGRLDAPALRASLQEVVRRHEALRTSFAERGGRPLQAIDPEPRPDVLSVDLTALRGRGPDEALELARREAGRPFELARGPLFRVRLLKLAERRHLLSLNLHHIVTDGWSMGILAREVAALYEAFAAGRSSPLAELPLQYADFACWQRRWLRSEVLEERLARRREQLEGYVETPLALATDRPRPARRTSAGASLTLAPAPELGAAVGAASRRHGVTAFMTLLAAFEATLYRYSGQRRFALGTPIAHRNRLEIEGLIGFFVNTLVIPAGPSPEIGFRELTRRVREVTLEAYEHQDLPFEKLVEELQPERDPSRTPLFQVMFVLQNAPFEASRLSGLEWSPVELGSGTAKFDLTLTLEERQGRFAGWLEYSRDLFDAATVERLAGHFESLLEGALGDPETPLAHLPLLGGAERHQALVEWNDTSKPCPQVPMVHERFSAWARRQPHATAVFAPGGKHMSYGELEARSAGLASWLGARGVGPEVRVALATERTLERVVATLAVVRSGGAYVSLDPAYPKERLTYLIEDARAPWVLTERRFLDRLPETGASLLCLDRDRAMWGGSVREARPSGVRPENLAYVVYTSGSTGRPKGVEIPHTGLMNLVRWHQDRYSVSPSDRGTQVASPAFDASIWELWPYLTAGASSHVPDEETRLSSAAMVRWWWQEGITLAYLPTPLAMGALGEPAPPGLEPRVRALIIGGDRLTRGPRPDAGYRLMNHYGPAEYSIVTTVVEVPARAERSGVPTIGRAIDNTSTYVLDRGLAPVPAGVTGELYVGGVGLARGYLGRPGLTAEKFVPDPLGAEPGSRFYRTGDLACYLPDGDLDFLGRVDHQVKLRGQRIELGEIEAVLDRHPAVRESAVLVREDRPGNRQLTAYLVSAENPGPAIGELRGFLGDRLPAYMVPSSYVTLAELPLTPNGKVDRRALPAPERAAAEHTAPRGPVEEMLAEVWAEVLQVERVGVHDSFFELGGHSLLATRVVSRLRRTWNVELTLARFFEAPTIAGLAAALTQARQTRERDGRLPRTVPPLAAVARGGEAPLSFAQERLWFLDQLDGGSTLYNVPLAFEVRGRLDWGALARSLAEVVRRHEVLRTTFAAPGGRPVQLIAPALEIALPVVDLSRLAPRPARDEAERRVRDEARRPFDLGRGPLFSIRLLSLGEREQVVALSMHHIVWDGWSAGILVRELTALYEAFRAGRPSPLAALPIRYADFARWQREWLTDEVLAEEVASWKERLGELPGPLELPSDRPRPAVRTPRGGHRPVVLPPALGRKVRAVSRRQGATLFMSLLAAFEATLYRWSGQAELAVGTPIAHRNRLETEGLIGFFVNTLVLPARFDRATGFGELLGQVRELALAAYEHQDLPFEKLVEALRPERLRDRAPLVQVMFVLQNAPGAPLELAGLEWSPLVVTTATAKFDLTLTLEEGAGDLAGWLEYSRDLFDATTVDRLGGHFVNLLAAAVADPETPVADLALASAAERHQLLHEANDTRTGAALDASVPELFEEQAGRSPDAVAVSFECAGPGAAGLSYRELGRRADRWARRLRRLGVRPEVTVGLCLERSADWLVAALGVLKAGGAYVPLDPQYPRERLAFMLEDAGTALVVADRRRRGLLPDPLPRPEMRVVAFDGESPRAASERTGVPCGARAENLAYAMYTSGSTGRPKGVGVPHRAIVRLVHRTDYVELGPADRVAQVSNTSFDAATFEIWGALLNGARVSLLSRQAVLSPWGLAGELGRQRPNTLFLTTALFNQAVREDPSVFASLDHLLFGGEVVDPARVREALAAGAPRRLLHVYGPTESTTFATWQRVRAVAGGAVNVPIGRPVANTRVRLLDRHGRPVPLGATGQLSIGGAGLARGYLGRPRLTARRFVPDARSDVGGERLYATGDLARRLADGSLEFLGRIDHQVKIRGFRIEPGEVETVLDEHAAVREAVVLVRGESSDPGGKRLVAYVVAPASSAVELRALAREKLPDYMVPGAFVFLDELPLNANGKVDRRALPAPAPERSALGEAYVAPRTPAEELLAEAWAQVLGVERVGVHDDFFELGGHSLLATQVVSRVRELFGVELPVARLFEAPTVARLAPAVAARRGRGPAPPPIVAAAPDAAGRQGDPPLSYAQERLWFLDQLEGASPAYNVPVALELRGAVDGPALRRSFCALMRRHEALATTFVDRQGRPVPSIAPDPSPEIVLVDLTELSPSAFEKALEIARCEALRPFDLARGPLLRVTLLKLSGERHLLALTLHHIVTDGWSMGILVRELVELYEAFAARRPASLPELPIQYGDFARWQRGWLTGEVLEAEVAGWRERLAGRLETLELPADRPRPAYRTARGASRGIAPPAELAAALRQAARDEGATVFMALLAGFEAVLHRYSGQTRFAVGTPIANRNRLETEGLIGFFVNTLVIPSSLEAGIGYRELLRRVREVTLEAYEHQDVPFEKLVEELQPERDRSRSPLFQVMLVVQNAPFEAAQAAGVEWSALELGSATAKFDLTLSLTEQPGRLAGGLSYSSDLFDATTVERLGAHFAHLLGAALADTETPLCDLPLFTGAERHQVLAEWNDTGRSYPSATLVELVEARFARAPEALAVSFEGAALTCRGLDRAANALARRLLALGVGRGERVAVMMDRSLELVIAVLAVVKAGGVYVPLDPEHPEERLAWVLGDLASRGHAGVVLVRPERASAAAAAAARLVVVDAAAIGGDAAPPSVALAGADAAYVIYTSGSTGRPKGTVNTHQGIVNRLLQLEEAFGLAAGGRLLHKTAFSFDVAVWEIFWPLASGAGLVMARPGGHRDPAYLARTIREEGVTALHFVPSMLQVFVEEPEVEWLFSLERVFSGGEALTGDLADRFYARLAATGARLYNFYGPAEAAVDVTWQPCETGGGHRVPIGRPISNVAARVLDSKLAPVPAGVAGELHLAGVQLAQGYLGRPRLTAERFVPDPFTAESRLYRTGDLVRWLPRGEIEYLGRIDHQVKLRGFRVEPGEIEALLAAEPEVREAVVVLSQDRGGARLVAYVVPARGAAGPAELTDGLRRSLAARLPEYMVPSAFVALPELPLNPNGKVDRAALPAPSWERTEAGYSAPRSPLEEWLADLWSELLGVPRVGVYDSFFELGGHSLLATQVVSRLREVWGAEIELARLFEAPTIAALAAAATAARGEGRSREPIRPVERGPEPPLSFAQERLWFLDQLEPGNPFYNISGALGVRGPLDLGLFKRCVDEVVRRHESLRTCFAQRAGRPFQVIAPALAVPLPLVDVTALPSALGESEARRRTLEELRRPFDLARLPLLRLVAFKLAGEHRLAVTIHHIVSDGWSSGVLTREIVELYGALGSGESPLPAPEIQYADFAVWQRRRLAGEVPEEELAYWRRQLEGLAGLELPTDRPRPAVETFRGASWPFALDPGLSRELKALSARRGVTPFMALLSAFKVMLARYSRQRDIAVGSPIANRTAVELEGVIGFFANTLVLRTVLAERASWRELLARVREMTLGAYAHQEVPFEKLVAELSPERDMSRSPLFQVMLVLQNQPRTRAGIAGLEFETTPVDTGIAKFDLTVFWREEDGRLKGILEYNSDLFDPTTALRMAADYRGLLRRLTEDVEAQPARVALLRPAAAHQVLREWNATRVSGLGGRPVHLRVEEQVERTPGATAVVDGGERLSYRELNAWANRLAHVLIGMGIGPERLVGICVERSVEMVVGLLAVLKAGGGAVALDPAYPESRTSAIIRDAGLSVLLVERHLRERLPAHAAAELELGGGPAAFASSSPEDPRVPVGLDHPIYAIYTSGSTGEPKGILVTHRAFANLVDWQLALSPAGGVRTVQFATFGFCVSFQEIFTSWCSGGTLVMAGEMVRRDVAGLARFLEAAEIERLHVPFAALKHLAEAAADQDRLPTRLREVVSAGEQLQVSPAVRRLFERLEGCVLRNQYGASETHVVSDCRLAGAPAPWPAIPPVGRPISNVAIYLLDRFLAPVALGAAGALYTAGRCDARGYLNDPAMTAHKFLPHPFAAEPGARLYRTGDLARHLPGGEIEYLGRIDAQVKIRGYRVELGEVETVLARDARVRDVAVLAHEGAAGGQRLVAYVVLETPPGDGDDPVVALRGMVRETLPEYMVPAVFVAMDDLPLNANGKLDRDALPVPEAVRHARRVAYVAPRGPVEEFVSGLWSEILGVERIGVHDGFFELGGHSLLATQVISQVRTALRIDLPLRRLFGAPTVAELAAAIVEEEPVPGQAEKLARLLLRVKRMSAQETEELLRGDLEVRAASPGEAAGTLSAERGIGGRGV